MPDQLLRSIRMLLGAAFVYKTLLAVFSVNCSNLCLLSVCIQLPMKPPGLVHVNAHGCYHTACS